MTRRKKIFWLLIISVFLLIQFYPVTRPEVRMEDNPNDLIKNVNLNTDISSKLKTACYDCHSNETIYPWYASVAPVKWLVYDHVREAREELNFSDWNSLSKVDMSEKLDDIATSVSEKEMPLKYYPLMHSNAKLSENDRQQISDWAESLAEELFD